MVDVSPRDLPDPEASESLSRVVYDRLRDKLMRAELHPHQRLKVRELSREMGTSETPVREALFQLAHQGAIEIKPRFFLSRAGRVHRALGSDMGKGVQRVLNDLGTGKRRLQTFDRRDVAPGDAGHDLRGTLPDEVGHAVVSSS